MKKVKVIVVGYGVIGQRLADGVSLQEDMELVGVVDAAPTLSVRALRDKGMPYKLYAAYPEAKEKLEAADIPVSGFMEDILPEVDVALDATGAGIGAKNKKLYEKHNVKAVFQGGEDNSIADVFFHGYANYSKGVGVDYLKLTSCNTTGLIRAIDCVDKSVGVEKVAITIIRRVADPGDYHRGLTNALKVEKAPSHQAVDLMTIMPHIDATGLLIHTPITHGHFISVVATPKSEYSKNDLLKAFRAHPRIKVVSMDEGFLGNASVFRYGRDVGNPRGDVYQIFVWEEMIVNSGKDIMFGIHIPQESVTIPETIDAIRACMSMQTNSKEGVYATNKYLGMI